MNAAKHVLHYAFPFVHSRGQKLSKVMRVQRLHETRAAAEQKVTDNLGMWFGRLGADKRTQVTVVDMDYGDPYMSQLTLTVDQGGDRSVPFNLSYHFAAAAQLLDELPVETQRRLTA